MHVVHIINNLPVGGAERFLVLLAAAQRQQGLRVEVLALVEPNPIAAALGDAVPFACLGGRRLNDVRLLGRTWRALRARRPDVVHTHLFYADVFGRTAARLAGVPVIVSTEHSTERTAVSARRRMAMRVTAPFAQRIAAVSASVAAAARQRLPQVASRIEVIPNGIDLLPWQQATPLSRAALGIEAGAFLVGAVGRLEDAKAHDVLVDAIAAIDDPRIVCAVAGDGPLRRGLEARARERGVAERCHWLGWRDDVPRFLATLDLYVQPSRYEGHSLALLEAMASGRACVVSDIPELVHTLGAAGCVAGAGDAPGLARSIARLAGEPNLRAQLGAAARARAAEFSISASALQYREMYERCVAERGGAPR